MAAGRASAPARPADQPPPLHPASQGCRSRPQQSLRGGEKGAASARASPGVASRPQRGCTRSAADSLQDPRAHDPDCAKAVPWPPAAGLPRPPGSPPKQSPPAGDDRPDQPATCPSPHPAAARPRQHLPIASSTAKDERDSLKVASLPPENSALASSVTATIFLSWLRSVSAASQQMRSKASRRSRGPDRFLPQQEVAPEDQPPYVCPRQKRRRLLPHLAGSQRWIKNDRHDCVAGFHRIPAPVTEGSEDGEYAPEQPIADRRDEFGGQLPRQIDPRQGNGRQDTAWAQR